MLRDGDLDITDTKMLLGGGALSSPFTETE